MPYHRVSPLYKTRKYNENKEGGKKYLGYEYGRGYGFGKRITLARNRAVGATKKAVIEQKWQKHERKMDSNLIVKALINGVLFKPALMNIDCEYYSIMNKNLITELRLPCIKIPLKPIIGFVKKNTKKPWVKIIKITKFFTDI